MSSILLQWIGCIPKLKPSGLHHEKPVCRPLYKAQGCRHCSSTTFKKLMMFSQWRTHADGPELSKKAISHAAIQVRNNSKSALNSMPAFTNPSCLFLFETDLAIDGTWQQAHYGFF
jgi:hypothetical protein